MGNVPRLAETRQDGFCQAQPRFGIVCLAQHISVGVGGIGGAEIQYRLLRRLRTRRTIFPCDLETSLFQFGRKHMEPPNSCVLQLLGTPSHLLHQPQVGLGVTLSERPVGRRIEMDPIPFVLESVGRDEFDTGIPFRDTPVSGVDLNL